MKNDEQALTIKQVANYLNISGQMAYNLVKQKQIKAFKVGSAVRILQSDLNEYINRQKNEFSTTGNTFVNTDDSLFVIKNLNCSIDQFRLTNINISLPRNEILAILGPSGSGKTLLLRSIAGLASKATGSIFFGTKRIDNISPYQRKIGFVFQDYALFPHLSAKKNIEFPMTLSRKNKNIKHETIKKAIKDLQIDNAYLFQNPGELPEGIKQLVAIGREKIREFDLFLMDEPMSHLDKDNHDKMRIFILKLLKQVGKTTILCVNDPQDALTISDYLVVLDSGKIIRQGETREVYNNPGHPLVMEILSNLGVNKIEVQVKNKNIANSTIPVNVEDGKYIMLFRVEEIKIDKNGIKVKSLKHTFYDGRREIAHCITDNENEIQLLLPIKTEQEFSFIPTNPLFIKSQ